MKIESIDLYAVSMPIVSPFTTSFGKNTTFDGLLVKLTSDGLIGWGEAAPWRFPAYSSECAATQFMMARDFIAPLLIGREIESGAQLQQALAIIKGNYFAKAAFDLAWWDLEAKRRELPLWRLIGGEQPEVDTGADFGIQDTPADLLDKIRGAVEAGYRRVKLKACPGWDLDMVRAVRGEFPATVIHIDCNSAYRLDDLELFQALDACDLAMIEQPLAHDDLLDHAVLQSQIKTPICLDESITSADKARQAAASGACRWVNIKLGRVGGLTNALKVHDVCRDAGIPCWVGGMGESAIGGSHNLAFATLPNIRYPSDIFPSDRFFEQDLGVPPVIHSEPSRMRPQPGPGIGVEPEPDRLAKLTCAGAAL